MIKQDQNGIKYKNNVDYIKYVKILRLKKPKLIPNLLFEEDILKL